MGRLRVVAGEWGGRPLVAPKGDDVRPSAERTREAVFSMLGPLDGERVLDLYCGTGALGLEALSRGAALGTFVDRLTGPVETNIDLLAAWNRCHVVSRDAERFLSTTDERFDLVFLDPPYRLADRLGPVLDEHLPQRLAPEGRVIAESAPDRPLELSLELIKERRYGGSLVRIYSSEVSR